MPPGPERDELLRKVKLFESYAKIENWIASPGHRSSHGGNEVAEAFD
jgi:hypothetical protein